MPKKKTDESVLRDLKALLMTERSNEIVMKLMEIALDDGHPQQVQALKMCADRILPVSHFEKAQNHKPTINISFGDTFNPKNMTIEQDDSDTEQTIAHTPTPKQLSTKRLKATK